MTENVINTVEVSRHIDDLVATARDGVTALKMAANMIHIPAREMAKIQTAIRKMQEATIYVENHAHNLPDKTDKVTKSAVKEALKDANQEQIKRAYTILTDKEGGEE